MSTKKTLTAQTRQLRGRQSQRLLRENILPANVYGAQIESVAISLPIKETLAFYEKLGDTQVFYLKIEGEKKERPVLFSEIQTNPLSGTPIHAVLRQINLKEKVEVAIPIELTGENKVAGSTVILVRNEVEVEALPTDLPESFVFDISNLTEINQAFTFNDLKYDQDKVKLLVDEDQLSSPLVILQAVKEETEDSSDVDVEEVTPATESNDSTDTSTTTDNEE